MGEEDRYADVPYWGMPDRVADPNRLALAARLHGLDLVGPESVRVLELGCGDGSNGMALAAAWPGARYVGLDRSEAAIARGQDLVARSGLDHVELRVADLLDAESPGEFDIILLHGLVSWVPDAVRHAALRLAVGSLAPNGIVMCDYDALPGWHRWSASRELLLMGAARPDAGPDQPAAAREAVALAAELNTATGLHAQLLAESLERVQSTTSHLLFHDDMNPLLRPFWLHEMVEIAAGHGLAYVGEALPSQWWEVHAQPAARVREFVGADPVAGQRFVDLVMGVEFKATIFGHAAAASRRTPLDVAAAADAIAVQSSPFDAAEVADWPLHMRIIGHAVLAAGPAGACVSDTAQQMKVDPLELAAATLSLASAGIVTLRVAHPPAAVAVAELPCVHPLVRAQAASSQVFTSFTHESVVVDDPLSHALLRLLDGTRTRDELAAEVARTLPGSPDPVLLHPAVDGVLRRFASDGLLQP